MDELAYALITPYSILKSRTGGIIGRLTAHARLKLAAVRMFVFSDGFVDAYREAISLPGMEPALTEAWSRYVDENLRADNPWGFLPRCLLMLFRGPDAVRHLREDVIGSPAVVSYVVSQVALQREMASVFWELTGPRGGQIVLQPAESFVGTDGKVRFDQVQQIAATRGDIALGFRRPSDLDDGLVLNPDRDTEWSIESGDEVVLLTSIKGPES